jgi:hypothetical protein
MTKGKGKEGTGSRTYLIDSIQLQDIMRYLMTRPYGEVVQHYESVSKTKPVRSKHWCRLC